MKYTDITPSMLDEGKVSARWGTVNRIDYVVCVIGAWLSIHYIDGTASTGQAVDYTFEVLP